MHPLRIAIASIALVAILAAGFLFIFREPFLQTIGDFLIVQDQLNPADVIHVISGENYRAEYGIQLYNQGYGKFLFFTGGWCPYHNINHAQYSKETALAQGISPNAIVTDEAEIDSTYAEAIRLKEWIDLQTQPVNSIMVVSDPHHMRRARWTYRRIFGDEIKIIMAPVPFEMSMYQRQWWKDAESRSMVKDEYLKFAFYIARHQLSWGKLRDWLANFDKY